MLQDQYRIKKYIRFGSNMTISQLVLSSFLYWKTTEEFILTISLPKKFSKYSAEFQNNDQFYFLLLSTKKKTLKASQLDKIIKDVKLCLKQELLLKTFCQ